MNYTERVKIVLKENGLRKTWLAEQLSMQYPEFWRKMKTNSFSKQEKAKINILIGKETPQRSEFLKRSKLSRDLKRMAKIVGNII